MATDKLHDMLARKQSYFQQSRDQGLPNRCPILDRCERRTETFARVEGFYGGGREVDHPNEPVVEMMGEQNSVVGGSSAYFFRGMCPEVALFDQSRFFPGFGGYATTSGQYDEYVDPRYEIFQTGHFSECAEYALDAHKAASRIRAAETNRQMTNNTFNVGDIQSGAVSLGGEAVNYGNTEFRGYPEPARQKVCSELDALERAIQAMPLDDPEKQKALAKIANVKAEPSPDRLEELVKWLKALGEIGSSATPFLTGIARIVGLT